MAEVVKKEDGKVAEVKSIISDKPATATIQKSETKLSEIKDGTAVAKTFKAERDPKSTYIYAGVQEGMRAATETPSNAKPVVDVVPQDTEKIAKKVQKSIVPKVEQKKKPEVPTLTIGKDIFSVDLSALAEYVAFDVDAHRYFTQENTYKILAHLSKQLPKGSKVADLGTACGSSALAFASNPDVQVSTIDSRKLLPQNLKNASSLPNVSFIQGDIANYISIYADAKIIYLDVHPHDGIQESKIYNELIASEFKGILILDDIHAFEGLNSFWNTISRKKIDATEYGHHSGTGIVVFSPTDLDVVIS